MNIALINTNRIKPPIAPIGLEYVAEAMSASGFEPDILDLNWFENPSTAVDDFFSSKEYNLVGLSLRNTDDCAFTSRQSFVGELADLVSLIREKTNALVAVGGVGFSVMPELVMEVCRADAGVWGEGESVFPELAGRLDRGEEWRTLAGMVCPVDGKWRRNPPEFPSLSGLPRMSRKWFDNPRYFREGGQAGIETKRGCPGKCIYCADPLAKGAHSRLRPPEHVAFEIQSLLSLGIDVFHSCDSEFNLPPHHAEAVCREIIRCKLGDKIRWYAYCCPVPFSEELAELMKRAGCVGVNFGTDSGDAVMLQKLGRMYQPEDVSKAVKYCRDRGMTVMLDLMIGSPGETGESIVNTVDLVEQTGADQAGVAVGVRVYPGTILESVIQQEGKTTGLEGGEEPLNPVFFLEPEISGMVYEILEERIGDDNRFFFFNPESPKKNYNYNANQLLVEAIQKGERGAYWDILRRLS